MATTQVSVLYHRWSSKCFGVMALAEDILATVGMARPAPAEELERLVAETRTLVAQSQQIGESFDGSELKRIARDGLEAAERLRSVIERTRLPENHPLRQIYDDFADHVEVFALSVDPRTKADLDQALDEAKRGETISWERLREETG